MAFESYFVADASDYRRPTRLLSRAIGRSDVQILGSLAVAVFAPMLLRILVGDLPWSDQQLQQTAIASAIAIVVGYILFRRLTVFPGAQASNYIWLSLTATFGLILVLFFFFRIEYSRFQFATSYVLSIIWFYCGFFAARRSQVFRFLLVPGGDTKRLVTIPGAEWRVIDSADLSAADISPDCNGIVADLRSAFTDDWMRFITEMAVAGIPVYHFKQVHESFTGRIDIEHLSENTLGSLVPGRVYTKIKFAADWLAAVAVLPLVIPFGLLVALAIRLDSPGPVIFRQRRMGFRGKLFTMYKFRTMADRRPANQSSEPTADEQSEGSRDEAITRDDDKRVTRIGRFLRRSRIDEIPQIINILRGEMSWIGPRPEAALLSEWYESELPFYRYRHIVRPGISGWAQVRQGHVAEADEVLEKLHYDFYYIKNCSLWLDLLIALRTLRTMCVGFGAR